MRRALIIVGLIGCKTSSPAIDAHTDPLVCKASLEAAIDRTCTVPADCVLAASADCCGEVDLAVRSGTQGGFAAVEATYAACLACGARGCFHAIQDEDGATPNQAGQAIVASCVANRCKAIVQ